MGNDNSFIQNYYNSIINNRRHTGGQVFNFVTHCINNKDFIDDLNKILEFVPFDSEIHTILGRIMGRYVSPFYGYIHYAYAALYKGDKDRMNKYWSRAKSLAKSNQEKMALKKFEQEYFPLFQQHKILVHIRRFRGVYKKKIYPKSIYFSL